MSLLPSGNLSSLSAISIPQYLPSKCCSLLIFNFTDSICLFSDIVWHVEERVWVRKSSPSFQILRLMCCTCYCIKYLSYLAKMDLYLYMLLLTNILDTINKACTCGDFKGTKDVGLFSCDYVAQSPS